MARSILVIDDERNMRWVLARALEKAGYEAVTAENGPAGLQAFARHSIDLVLLDLKMPGMDGLAVLRELRSRSRETPILLLTAYATIPTAVEALQAGASDYVRKPFNLETILSQINRFLAQQTDRQAEGAPAAALPAGFAEFVGAAPAVSKPLAQAAAAAQTTYPVLLCGEAGSGRRHLARLIYRNAAPAQPGRLAELDCAGVPAAILQKELLDESAAENGRRWQQTLGGTLLLANVEAIEEGMLPALAAHLCGYLHSAARPHGLRLLLTASAPLPAAWGPLLEEAFVIELPPSACVGARTSRSCGASLPPTPVGALKRKPIWTSTPGPATWRSCAAWWSRPHCLRATP